MKFFETKVETAYKTWEVHSCAEHSAIRIHFLGLNEAGWIKLQFDPRFANNDAIMAEALQSACINMAHPDEELDVIGKAARFSKAEDSNSVTVEAEDIKVFLNHLSWLNCITEADSQLISADLSNSHIQPLENSNVSKTTLSCLPDENLSTDHHQSFVH